MWCRWGAASVQPNAFASTQTGNWESLPARRESPREKGVRRRDVS